MCGVVAVFSPSEKRALVSVLADNMLATLKHRGPDDVGIWSDDGIALGNRRLAILDLSPTGHQPMTDPVTGTTISYNGEWYGHQDLRASLDYDFRGTSDTETVLAAWRKWGIDTPRHLRGMFAFALWDAPNRRLVLVRDRLGIKNLYYAHAYTPESCWFVASEVRAIRAVAKCELDWTSLAAYLRLGHIPSPRTAFQNVCELPPGCVGIIEQDEIRITPYWDLEEMARGDGPGSRIVGRDPAIALSSLFRTAVRTHLQSDVPIALFAGGGSDSRAIAKVAAELGDPLVGLHVIGDQRDYQNAMGIVAEGHLRKMIVDPIEPTEQDLNAFLDSLDQPTVDGTNLFFASRLAQRSGFKVVLSGLGGDEMFAGYPTFKLVPWIQRLQTIFPGGWPWSKGRLYDATIGSRSLRMAYAAARGVFSQAESVNVTRGTLQEACRALDLEQLLPDVGSVRELEMKSYMQDQLLRDTDVFGMAHGVEIRPPFLDHVFVETALAHPMDRKEFCRALDLPAPGVKRGFSLPMRQWLDTVWSDPLPECSVLDPGIIYGRLPSHAHWSRQWSLVVLARWLRAQGGIT